MTEKKQIRVGRTFSLEVAPSDTPIMSSEDFRILTANNCGRMLCGRYQAALQALRLSEDPNTIVKVEEAAELHNNIFQYLIEDGITTNQEVEEVRERSTRMTLTHVTEAARAVSYKVGTTGQICASGPQDYTRNDGQVALTICGEDEDFAQKNSLGLVDRDPAVSCLAEVKVEIQIPPNKKS